MAAVQSDLPAVTSCSSLPTSSQVQTFPGTALKWTMNDTRLQYYTPVTNLKHEPHCKLKYICEVCKWALNSSSRQCKSSICFVCIFRCRIWLYMLTCLELWPQPTVSSWSHLPSPTLYLKLPLCPKSQSVLWRPTSWLTPQQKQDPLTYPGWPPDLRL